MVNTILSVFTISPSCDTVCPLELGLEECGGVVLYGAELKEPHTELLLSFLFCPSLALCSVTSLDLGNSEKPYVSPRRCGFMYQGSQWTRGTLTQGSRADRGSL